MDITKIIEQDIITLKLQGRIDTITSPNLESELKTITNEYNNIVLDFKDVDYISSAGLRVLLLIQKVSIEKKGTFTINNVCENVMDVFDMTGFSKILNIK